MPADEIIGYLSALSAPPGATLDVHVSTDAASFSAQLVRLRHGDVNPAGPGERIEPIGSASEHPGRRQTARPGSFATAGVAAVVDRFALHVLPTWPARGAVQGVLAFDPGHALIVQADGTLALRWGDTLLRSGVRPVAWRWLAVAVDLRAGSLDVRETGWPRRRDVAASTGLAPMRAGELALACRGVDRSGRLPAAIDPFDGRIERPQLWSAGRALELSLQLHQGPQLHVTGHAEHRDSAFAAVHFHSDDLLDAGWAPDLQVTLPGDLPSGPYAIELRAGAGADVDRVPLIVTPPPGRATADVAVLFPTFSYLAYANERLQEAPRDVVDDADRALPIVPDRGDLILRRRRDLGLSVYDVHGDGSGCCFSSARRPIVNLRPDHRNWQTHAPRAFACDLYLVDWLRERGTAFDALTDHELHATGAELLSRYRVVIAGSHPEYWSGAMLDALEAYLEAGGRLMYLGGNGFYWVTSVDPERPWLIEVRRGHNGTRPWEPRARELAHQTTGEPGGLWRYRGRDPNRLVGVGFAAQGYGPKAAAYHRLAASRDPRAAWIFEGVGDEPIGDDGLIMGGAAGDEIDRADPWWGTPPHALVVATSAGAHPDSVSVVVEDLLIAHPAVGGRVHAGVRSDLAFFETPSGGAVFSAGSMGWNGCLSARGYANPVAQVTGNVLDRFRDPAPFPAPPP